MKESFTIKNPTNHFDPAKDKANITLQSQETYRAKQSKIKGYEARLYWQYKYCCDHDGQTFFYTLTYNDLHCPRHYGMRCFDYDDLRELLTGSFRKDLLRKYGTTFKYFISCELGDGKGERGYHNNPHYHCLFFLEPANNKKYPYKKISPVDFRHLIREYWQGFDEDVDGWHDYKQAKYGITKEGEWELGLVCDFHAESYACKYVIKDAAFKMREPLIRRTVLVNINNDDLVRKPFIDFLLDQFGYTDVRKMYDDLIGPDYPHIIPWQSYSCFEDMCIDDFIDKYDLTHEYNRLRSEVLSSKVDDAIKEWRNRFSSKVRISHGVGDYALENIDKLNPVIRIPGPDGWLNRPLNLYYYRKLFMRVVKDPHSGNNVYVLNDDGIKYRIHVLPKQIDRKVQVVKSALCLVEGDENLYDKILKNELNKTIIPDYDRFFETLNYLYKENNKDEILRNYAIYKLVYEHRFYSYSAARDIFSSGFPPVDVERDYERFLHSSVDTVDYDDLGVSRFLNSPMEGYRPYLSHPYFLRNACLFSVLDLITDYFYIQVDNKMEKDAKERARLRQFHKERELAPMLKKINNKR